MNVTSLTAGDDDARFDGVLYSAIRPTVQHTELLQEQERDASVRSTVAD